MYPDPQTNMPSVMKSVLGKFTDVLEDLEDTVTIPGYPIYLNKGAEFTINAAARNNLLEQRAIYIAGQGNQQDMESFNCKQLGKPPNCE